MTGGRSRARSIVLALAVGVVAAFVLGRVTSDDRRTGESPLVASPPAPSATRLESTTVPRVPAATAPEVAGVSSTAGMQQVQASPQSRATPQPFDLARLPNRWRQSLEAAEAERFPTKKWFTEEDQHHPERYFELAARKPELNRPEEREKTLEYFLAYRAKLERDLPATTDDARRREIEATRARYDDAIAKLQALINSPSTPPSR